MSPRRKAKAPSADPTRRRALGYIRVSTEEQAEDGGSLAAQETQVRAYMKAQEWTCVGILSDPGVSGTSFEGRDGMARARAMLANGEADYLVAIALDRHSRNVDDIRALLSESVERGWGLVSVSESLDTSTATGKLFVHMVAGFAEYVRDVISERTRSGMAAKTRAGGHMGRHTVLAPEVVGEIRTWRDDVGMSWNEITKALNALDRPSARGGPWAPSSAQSAYNVNLNLPPKKVREATQ